jgi:hypothetical protein
MHGINVVADLAALRQENISLERPITAQLDAISLKSALNIIVKQVDLTWVIRDEALTITTKDGAKEKLVQKTYLVTDLVVPIENSELNELQRPIESIKRNFPSPAEYSEMFRTGRTPHQNQDLSGGSPVGSLGSGFGGSSGTGAPYGAPQGGGNPIPGANNGAPNQQQQPGPKNAMPQHLINLITKAIAPGSWSADGGSGTIDYFPLGMTLVVNQTPDIQEQIQDLLQQLRRLQDIEVSLEVRLITLSDNFFERMGVDLDLNIKTDTTRYQPQLTSGQFAQPGFIQSFNPSKLIAGILPGGAFTQDLNIPINNNSFSLAYPPFGFQRELSAGNTGGLSIGLAFLSDIQVYLFMEAAQSDERFNIMQAPRLTMFNGQSATLTVGSFSTFVTGVQPVNPAGYTYFLPIVTPLLNQTSVGFQPVVTGDRRFVRINMQLGLQNLKPSAQIFPITVTSQVLTGFNNLQAVGPPLVLTQFIQQPQVDFLQVSTTVQVPDGGTVVIGGLKRLAEGRNEFGPPILSKIPYLNRLVKNVGYGRTTEHILMLITPRIIITEEEETAQTGVIAFPGLVQ